MVVSPLGPRWERHSPVPASLPWARAEGAGIGGIYGFPARVPRGRKPSKAAVSLGRLWSAVLKAGHELGVQGNLARSIARELAEDPGQAIIVSEEKRLGHVHVVASHLCGENCSGIVGECLTALVVETVIQEKRAEPLFVSDTRPRVDGTCEVVLAPWRLEIKASEDIEGNEGSLGPIVVSP